MTRTLACSAFLPFAEKMRAEGLPELAIASFRRHYFMLRQGHTGTMPEASILPVHGVADVDALAPALEEIGRASRSQAVVIKLNGGLGTSMGLSRAKSLLPIKDGLSFLDLIARQAAATDSALVFMDSFSTHADTLAALSAYPRRDAHLPQDFLQHKVPKVDQATLAPVDWPEERLSWCPPGHGDLYTALFTSGVLSALLSAGRRYAFVSNSDNVGASLDPRILGHFVQSGAPFLMEVCDRTAIDRKGGHLARQAERLVLRERAQCAPEDLDAFQDITRYRYFNTNNIWLDLWALDGLLRRTDGPLPLPLIRNAKTVDPRDPTSTPVYQLESAMGAAIAIFDKAQAMRVPRARFVPVKTASDLLRTRSDAMMLTPDSRLVAARPSSPPVEIDLDPRFYRLIHDLERRFPQGPPSLVDCTSLVIRGDVRFGSGVRCVGRVVIDARGEGPQIVPDGSTLGGDASPFPTMKAGEN